MEKTKLFEDTDRQFVVDFWYWISKMQLKNTSTSEDKQLTKKLEKCKDMYEYYYPTYLKEGKHTQPEFEELLAYVYRHSNEDGTIKDDWLVYNFVRASIHRVIIRNDSKMFKLWVKNQ